MTRTTPVYSQELRSGLQRLNPFGILDKSLEQKELERVCLSYTPIASYCLHKQAESRKPETLLTPKHEEKFNELLRRLQCGFI